MHNQTSSVRLLDASGSVKASQMLPYRSVYRRALRDESQAGHPPAAVRLVATLYVNAAKTTGKAEADASVEDRKRVESRWYFLAAAVRAAMPLSRSPAAAAAAAAPTGLSPGPTSFEEEEREAEEEEEEEEGGGGAAAAEEPEPPPPPPQYSQDFRLFTAPPGGSGPAGGNDVLDGWHSNSGTEQPPALLASPAASNSHKHKWTYMLAAHFQREDRGTAEQRHPLWMGATSDRDERELFTSYAAHVLNDLSVSLGCGHVAKAGFFEPGQVGEATELGLVLKDPHGDTSFDGSLVDVALLATE